MPTLHQEASESVVFMLLDVDTMAAEEMEVSMEVVVTEDMDEDVDESEEETPEEVMEGLALHMKMEFTSQMSPVTLKIQSGPHSQTIQGKGSLTTRYE